MTSPWGGPGDLVLESVRRSHWLTVGVVGRRTGLAPPPTRDWQVSLGENIHKVIQGDAMQRVREIPQNNQRLFSKLNVFFLRSRD